MMWMICLFGGLGAMARYVLDVSIQQGWNRENRRTNRNFPLSTLVINGVASLCAGQIQIQNQIQILINQILTSQKT